MKKQFIKVISGDLRGRNVKFIESNGLRPTPSRVRETLFNWLQGKVFNKHCLDLFAGSGAIGIEAISQGAKWVSFVEKNYKVSRGIQHNIAELNIKNATVLNKSYDEISFKSDKDSLPVDIVFIDPPYDLELLEASLLLVKQFKPSYVYIEDNKNFEVLVNKIKNYKILKQKKSGQVHYGLLSFFE